MLRTMARIITPALLCLAVVHCADAAGARGGCPLLAGWSQASSNGELELSMEPEPCDEAAVREGRYLPLAVYRLERVGPPRQMVWQMRSAEIHGDGLVASDGDYVLTADRSFLGAAITIRNSAGAVIRSLSREDVISIPEQLAGAYWWIVELDPTEEFVELRIMQTDDVRFRSRRVQLMDGRVIGRPATPERFEVPRLACPLHMKLHVRVYGGGLWQECRGGREGGSWGRSDLFEDGRFRLVEEWMHEPTSGDGVFRRRAEAGPRICETIYRGGRLMSERCSLDVNFSP